MFVFLDNQWWHDLSFQGTGNSSEFFVIKSSHSRNYSNFKQNEFFGKFQFWNQSNLDSQKYFETRNL